MRQHVGDWVVTHADGAKAYPAILQTILVDTPHVCLDQVDHSSHQCTRFHRHPATGEEFPFSRIRVTAGTQLIEKWWDLLKHGGIPEEVGIDRGLLDDYALAVLWKSYASGDPMEDLGLAVQSFIKSGGKRSHRQEVVRVSYCFWRKCNKSHNEINDYDQNA